MRESAGVIKARTRSYAAAVRDVKALVAAIGNEARNPIRRRVLAMGASAVPALVATLDHSDPFARWEAVNLLGEMADSGTAKRVLDFALREDEVHARWRSFWAVTRFDPKQTVPSLLRNLQGMNTKKRWRAALILSMLGRMEAGPELVRGLKSSDEWQQWEALGGIKSLALAKVEKRVGAFLDAKRARALRQEAVLTLGAIGTDAAIRIVIRALSDSEPEVRWRASLALSGSGRPEVLRALRRQLRRERDPGVRGQLEKDISAWRT
jgi:HEAT repeat protein